MRCNLDSGQHRLAARIVSSLNYFPWSPMHLCQTWFGAESR